MITLIYFYFSSVKGVKYCDQLVCLCLSVCSHISKTTCPKCTKFSVRYLRLWLGPTPVTMQYAMYFCFHTIDQYRYRLAVCYVVNSSPWLTRWRCYTVHPGQSLQSPITFLAEMVKRLEPMNVTWQKRKTSADVPILHSDYKTEMEATYLHLLQPPSQVPRRVGNTDQKFWGTAGCLICSNLKCVWATDPLATPHG